MPTVADRVAQMVVKRTIEADLEAVFLADSYGYRPGKSALDAVGVTRKRCWAHDWVLEFDIKGLFDNIDHTLLLRAVRKHVTCPWAVLYIERWLTAPMSMEDGTRVERTRGTPQGGVVSPLLANLFLHYAFDLWMTRTHPELPWCRYADDGLVHCRNEQEAQAVMATLQARLAECHLEMHPTKTKVVYRKDGSRKGSHVNQGFDFLGYGFRPRLVKNSRRAACSGASRPLSIRRPSLPCGRRYGRPTCATGPRSRWQTSPMRSIQSYEAGSSIMGATVPQRCIRCSAMSTGRWWHGRCGSTSASQVTGRGQASSLRRSQKRTRISSHIGGKALSARSADGSLVWRESYARFCERPEVQFLRPTHHSLHWVMDMVFRDDECRVRTNHALANFTTIKHMACNLLRRPSGKDSLRVRRKVAGWDDELLARLVMV